MGASSSKVEDDKVLLLCRERIKFVKQALEGRCLLADAHVAYIQSLRNAGIALAKFLEPEITSESCLYTRSTPETLALTDKSISQFSNSSAFLSQNVETSEPFSPVPSLPSNPMKAAECNSRTVQERLPIPVTATVQRSLLPNIDTESNLDESFETPLSSGTAPWDYFGPVHPVDGKGLNHGCENADDIGCLRGDDGVPQLDDQGEKISANKRIEDSTGSEDEFDRLSTEPLVQIYRNRTEASAHTSSDVLPDTSSVRSIRSPTEQQNEGKGGRGGGVYEAQETSEVTLSKTISYAVTRSIVRKEKQIGSENKIRAKDFFTCIKEIEDLFLKASDAGREVPRMLEADKSHYRPLFPAEKACKSNATAYITACFTCCSAETHIPQAPAPNEVKYLTWHGSVSSHSSSSRNPLAPTSKDEVEDLGDNLFGSICMNSGSHASTLDRLYAWERKLYDEVKASGMIRRAYDMKCKLLREQDSRGEHPSRIDKTRASVKDLHSRIRVAIHRIESISKTIEELRDKELQPQLEELIAGLTQMWKMMLDCHKHQCNIITEATNNCSMIASASRSNSENHRQATILLQFELTSLCSSFTKWISSHRSYLESINGWLLKCISLVQVRQKSSRRKNLQFSPRRSLAPPIFVTCRDWLKLLNELPTIELADAIKDVVDVTATFLPQQEKGQGKKRASEESREELQGNDSTEDLHLNYDSLQSSLVVFLDRLKTYADASLGKYESLQRDIDDARAAYERSDVGGVR